MTETTPPSSAGGLRGQSAGSTAICTVGKAGVGLTYRGYSIEDLAEKCHLRGSGPSSASRPIAESAATWGVQQTTKKIPISSAGPERGTGKDP